jgi:plasmid stabilization system protein ParE
MSFAVRWTAEAKHDVDELYDFLLLRNPEAAGRALAAIRKAVEMLTRFPFSCRVATRRGDVVLRELVIPFGKRGYVALFEIDDDRTVTVLAVRHQREDDYH